MQRIGLVAAALAVCLIGNASAQPAPVPAPAPAAPPQVAGWAEFAAELQSLPSRMLAKLPPEMQRDPQVQQEIGRLALEGVANATIAAVGASGDHPMFLPSINVVLNVGQPNADTTYRTAQITPGGTYRLRGRRGSLRMVRIGQSGPRRDERTGAYQFGPMIGYFDVNALHVDAQDRFDVLLSPARPAGYSGDWWQLDPAAGGLVLRLVGADWPTEREPTLSIERVDGPAVRPRPSAAELEQRLRRLPAAMTMMASMFVDHVEGLRREGYVNKLKVFDVSQMGGLTGQFYYEGAYDLRPDEALIVEAKVPSRCLYHSIILTNPIYETTDWYNNHSSLNDTQAKSDADGILRVVVSARDPGVPNWLDTAGYPQGAIQGRWTECDAQPVPTVRKVSVAKVRAYLPAATPSVTPVERERLIRDRRSALQQRPLW